MDADGHGRRCSEKRRYPTRAAADEALLDIMIARAFAPDDDPVRTHACPIRTYKCFVCDGHHLTTTPKRVAAAGRATRPAGPQESAAANQRPREGTKWP